MEVITGVCEDNLRIDAAFQPLEDVLDRAADVGQEAVPEVVHLDARVSGTGQERSGARPGLDASFARRREDDPVDLEVGIRSREREQRSPAPDLDVVCVAADREDATQRLSCREAQQVRPRATVTRDVHRPA